MTAWTDYEKRINSGKTIAMQLSSENLARNRYYVRNIADTVVFLVTNELSFRGDHENISSEKSQSEQCNNNIGGLFLRLFEFALKKDSKLRCIAKNMPQNAKYTSPEIQNEVIDCLREMVQKRIVDDFNNSDIQMFCLKCDETRNSSNVEDLSVVVRFVINGKPVEHLLSMSQLVAVDAESITSKILDELHEHSMDPVKILSQCFDGAAVMSGRFGGVQAVMQKRTGRNIPYIHCMNHQLHLVVVHCMQREPKAKRFFELCEQLYVFFRRHFLTAVYQGKTLKRLMEQRWTGHLETAKIVSENRQEILEALMTTSENDSIDQSMSTEAAGLHIHVVKPEFDFMAAVVVRVLSILQPANAQLQGKSCNLADAIQLVSASVNCLKQLRNEESFNELAGTAGCLALSQSAANDYPVSDKRVRRQNTMLANCVIYSTTGQSDIETLESAKNQKGHQDQPQKLGVQLPRLRQAYYNILDNVINELNDRFVSNNFSAGMSVAISTLIPQSTNSMSDSEFLCTEKLMPLTALLQQNKETDITVTLDAELSVARTFLLSKFPHQCDLQQAMHCILPYKDAFPVLFWHYAAALTVGVSTATCENSFSCLTRILRPSRRSMSHDRKSSLVLLAFGKEITSSLNMDEFVTYFARKSRRIQLI